MALPKGHIDPGETPVQAAAREVLEETGLTVELMRKLGEVSYTYRFQQRTISKVVEFFMFRWVAGEIDHITEAMRREVHVAWWVPLSEAATELSYPGERRMAARALSELPARPGPEDLGGT